MHRLAFLIFIASAFLLSACAEPNPDAPAGEGMHTLDGSYLDGTVHGPVAKQDLTFCQACHADQADPPRFNVGIDSAGGFGCEGSGSCHGADLAHPLDWAGPNATFHYSAGNVQGACTLCHGSDLSGGTYAPSCLVCHDSVTTFTLDCASCHGYPPDGTLHAGTISGVDHSAVPLSSHSECTDCHGMSESGAGGGFEPATNYTLFDKATDTLGDHWDGSIQMNNTVAYNPSTLGCAVVCHSDDDTLAPMPDSSGLPVVLKNF
ncbi:MAG: hypothetical protein RRA15_12270 [bacterium]|nr:hypothetical protein [bacterium]MDT8367242.1 hypothetical protein [bacterium]